MIYEKLKFPIFRNFSKSPPSILGQLIVSKSHNTIILQPRNQLTSLREAYSITQDNKLNQILGAIMVKNINFLTENLGSFALLNV